MIEQSFPTIFFPWSYFSTCLSCFFRRRFGNHLWFLIFCTRKTHRLSWHSSTRHIHQSCHPCGMVTLTQQQLQAQTWKLAKRAPGWCSMGDFHWFSICNGARWDIQLVSWQVFFFCSTRYTDVHFGYMKKYMYYPTEYGRKVCLRLAWIEPDKSLPQIVSLVRGQCEEPGEHLLRARSKFMVPFWCTTLSSVQWAPFWKAMVKICEKRNTGLRETTRNPCAMGAAGIFGTTLAWKFAHPLGFVWLTAKVSQHMLLSC